MRAIGYRHLRSTNEAECLEDLLLPDPIPEPLDLLVQVEAVSVNPVDTKVRRSQTPVDGEVKVLGWDCAGTVVGMGDAVQGFAVGDPVWYAGAVNRPGCNSELHLVDHRLAARRPQCLSAAEAAALPLTAITAWELLVDRLRLTPPRSASPSTLLVVGGAGGVGSILVQLAQVLTDLEVVATTSRPETDAWLAQFGVRHTVNHLHPLTPQIDALQLPPVTAVISLTHTDEHFPQLVDLLEPQGALALIDDPPAGAINVLAMKRKSLSLHWELMFTRSLYQTADQALQGQCLATVAEMVDQGRLRSTLQTLRRPIQAATLQEAHRALESGRAIGKWVLEGWP